MAVFKAPPFSENVGRSFGPPSVAERGDERNTDENETAD
jgi:hypothetical protein